MFEETYRAMNDRLAPPERLVQATLQAVRPKRRFSVRRAAVVALAFVLCLMITTSALAATVPEFNSWLYTIAPDIALYFRPVRMADENNGVRMEVEAIRILGRQAQIYVTVTDLEGGRLDETVDLFDSYALDVPGDSSAYCSLERYDPDSNSATFLIHYTSVKEITQDKVTFVIRKMLTQKQHSAAHIYPQDYGPFDSEAESFLPGERVRGGGISLEMMDRNDLPKENVSIDDAVVWHEFIWQTPVLMPESISVELTEGVRLTGVGYVDGMLHIQLHYDNIVVTDNNGYIELDGVLRMQPGAADPIIPDNNGRTVLDAPAAGSIPMYMSIAFWDEAGTGSYEEYIFDVPPSQVSGLRMIGRFVTCKMLVDGPWSVTFPIEETP